MAARNRAKAARIAGRGDARVPHQCFLLKKPPHDTLSRGFEERWERRIEKLSPHHRPAPPRRRQRLRRRGRLSRHPLRRGGVQHLHDRLPGGADRPLLPRPDRGHDPAAHRQLRHRRRTSPSRAGPGSKGSSPASSPSAPRATAGDESLVAYLRRHGVPALQGIDTRAVVRRLRERGALRGVLTTERSDVDRLAAELADFPTMTGRALVDEVTCAAPYEIAAGGGGALPPGGLRLRGQGEHPARARRARGAADRRCRRAPRPARCLALPVDGVVLSNGPGDPEPLTGIIDERPRAGRGRRAGASGSAWGTSSSASPWAAAPSSSSSATTAATSRCATWAPARSRSPARTTASRSIPTRCPACCAVTQLNLNDGTVEGFAVDGRPVFSVQYHPEAAPGPHDASRLFDRFLDAVARK